MVRVAICDSEGAKLASLRTLLEKSGETVNTTEYTTGEHLIWDVKSGRIYFDIFFIGSKINALEGLEIAKHIRIFDEDAIIIFLTEDIESCSVLEKQISFASLVKPVIALQFERIFARALERVEREQTQLFSTTHLGHTNAIKYSYISYVSNERGKIIIHLRSAEARQYSGEFSDFISLLTNSHFVRCHRNYIVNLSRVTSFSENNFYLDDVRIPISRKHLAVARDRYNKHLFAAFLQE